MRGFFILFCISVMAVAARAQSTTIESFSFDSDKKAALAWRAQNGSPPVRATAQGMTIRMPFASELDRVYWDRITRMDLSDYDMLSLELTCDKPEALRSFTLYLKSGNGWFVWGKPLPKTGRQTLHIMKSDFEEEGTPAGWDQIQQIRISPWKGEPVNASATLHHFEAHRTSVLLLQSTLSTPDKDERTVSQRSAQRISNWLTELNIPHGAIAENELSFGRLARAQWIILPYNPTLPLTVRTLLTEFVEAGGRLMVLYSSDEALASMMGFRLGDYQSAPAPGAWASIAFTNPGEWRVPERVFQESWNIRPVYPEADHARVAAWWENASGTRTEDPAWTASDRGVWMSHILLQGDDEGKRSMLAGLLAKHDPSLWEPLAKHAYHHVGHIGPHSDFSQAVQAIRSDASSSPHHERIVQQLDQSRELHARMKRLIDGRKFADALDVARACRRSLVEAYARAQAPREGELRGVWDHAGTGLYPGDWSLTTRLLKEHGINSIFVNVAWAGLAHYKSSVVPTSDTYRLYGDQLAQCIQAARADGLDVHVWFVCWNLTGASDAFVDRMTSEGRVIQNATGQNERWLNPAHPDNQRMLLDSIREVLDHYDVDGIHLDYIRYPIGPMCYAPYTRRAFESWLGRTVKNWPADAMEGGRDIEAYRQFRVDQINLVVRGVRRVMKESAPDVKLSAAVWGNYPSIIQSIGQDWGAWLKRGEVDFFAPMNYTADAGQFAKLTQNQLQLSGARGRIMPGIGVTSSESQLTPDQVIHQINELRRLGANGFVLFDLNHTLRAETLPMLRMGVTRPSH